MCKLAEFSLIMFFFNHLKIACSNKKRPAVGVSVKVGALGAAVNACERCRLGGYPFPQKKMWSLPIGFLSENDRDKWSNIMCFKGFFGKMIYNVRPPLDS